MTKRSVIITTSILVGIMMIFTILFGVVFCAWNINLVYKDDFVYKNQTTDILAASKIKKGCSIFGIDRDEIANNIETTTLEIKFTLAEGSIYDENHLLNSTSQEITISISGFSPSSATTF